MIRKSGFWVAGLLAVLPLVGAAQVNLLPAGGLAAGGVYGPVTRTVVAVSGAPFAQAVRLQTTSRPANVYDAGLTLPTSAALAKDDVVAGEIWLRRLAPAAGDAFVVFNFEKAGPNYDKSHAITLASGSTNWTRFRFAFQSVGDYSAGAAHVALHLGFPPQTIQVGGLVMTNYARTQPLSAFPNDLTYSGREPDAAWRAPAAQRIEQFRKAKLTVTVRDPAGNPVPGARVEVRQIRHAFGFGTAVDGARLLGKTGTAADRLKYQSYLTNWFNKVVLENDLKWPVWEGPGGVNTATNALKWFQARGIPVRGHNLIWPGTSQPYFLPADVPALFANPAALRSRIANHFADILGRTRGLCTEWDVINEALHERAIEGVLGRQELAEWFKQARALDPAPALYYNEYENLELPTRDGTQRLLELLTDLRQRGAPMDGVGLQAHFGSYLTPPQEVYDRISLLLNTGGTTPGPVATAQITELDVNVRDEQTQADYLRDFLTVTFSHPRVNGVLQWGFWAGSHWLPDAALIRRDWTLKPNGIQFSNLVFREWWTTTNLLADANGIATTRGFKGDYQVRILVGAEVRDLPVSLTADTPVEVVVPVAPPALKAQPKVEGVRLTWPADGGNYRVEVSGSLNPVDWQPVVAPPRLVGGSWEVLLADSGGDAFFRLSR